MLGNGLAFLKTNALRQILPIRYLRKHHTTQESEADRLTEKETDNREKQRERKKEIERETDRQRREREKERHREREERERQRGGERERALKWARI